MSGWIKLEKDLREDRRFTRIVDALLERDSTGVTSVTHMRFVTNNVVTQVLGGLAQLWMYADTHIREDDTLDIPAHEVDKLVGIEGFAKLMPTDWLEVIDEHSVRLPNFQAHNGTEAKKRAVTAKRVKRHRIRAAVTDVTPEKRTSVTDALPDQTRPDQTKPDQDQNCSASATPTNGRKPKIKAVEPEWFAQFRLLYPPRSGDQPKPAALRAAHARQLEGHTPEEFLNGARRYAEFCVATGKVNTEYVQQWARFLGPAKPFLQPWSAPATKADTRLTNNLTAAEEFMRRTEVTQ